MSDSLTKFLQKSGLISRASTPKNDTKPTRTAKAAEITDKPATPKKTVAKKTQPRQSSPRNGRRLGPNTGAKFSNYDPDYGRLTVAKKEKFHPTNSLNTKNINAKIRVVPLGGMEQVGQNMMFIEAGDDIVVIDTGFLFPDAEHLGIDVLLPDISYLVKNKHKIRGVVFTHGHLDHIGGAPYIIPELGFPQMYATRLTKELILVNAEDGKVRSQMKITEINPTSKIKLGKFEIEFFHVNHSIPDGVGIVIKTPYGHIVHTSDFKIDHHPSDEQPADLGRIAEIGKQGVLLAMVDSTNALKKGHTISESIVEKQVAQVIERTQGRLIITTFASSIGRISKIVEAAEKVGRTVFLSGRSMEKNIAIARKLNYLKCREKTIQRMNPKANKMDPRKVLILSTGSQGEPLAALTRMAAGTHRDIKLSKHDTILFSSSPIIGNEEAIVSVLNNLADIGVNIIDKTDMDVYVSGHGYAEEVKMMTALLNPKYFAPIHGEIYMRHGNRDLIVSDLDFNPKNAFIMKNGQGINLDSKGARLMTDREAIPCKSVMIELGEKISEEVLDDRTIMAEGGCIIVTLQHKKGTLSNLDLRAKGFRHMNMDHEIFKLIRKDITDSFARIYAPEKTKTALEGALKANAQKLLLQKFRKEAMVEVIVVAV
jgi:ribonuclease J